jgi:peptidylprolyl isomerase
VAGKERKRQIARERYQRRIEERERARAKARQRWTIGGAAAAVVAIVAIILALVLPGSGDKSAASASSPAVSTSPNASSASSPAPPPATHADGCTSKLSSSSATDPNFPILPPGVSPVLKTEPTVTIPAGPVPTTLQTKDLVVGSGEKVQAGDTVTMNYVGLKYVDCTEFDSSWSREQTATFSLQGVVPGFQQGVAGMNVGGRREIIVPPSLGYGEAGSAPKIGPNEELVFVVDVLATSHTSAAAPGPASTAPSGIASASPSS